MDEDALAYLVSDLPGATISPTSVYGEARLEWTPTTAQFGTYDATVTVTDSGNAATDPASASRTFRVIVRAANAGPRLAPVGDKQATQGPALAFSLRGPAGDRTEGRRVGEEVVGKCG